MFSLPASVVIGTSRVDDDDDEAGGIADGTSVIGTRSGTIGLWFLQLREEKSPPLHCEIHYN